MTFYLAKKLEYGLKLVRDRAGIDEFVINADAVIDMDHYVNDLVKRHYKNSSSMSLQNDDEDAGSTVE